MKNHKLVLVLPRDIRGADAELALPIQNRRERTAACPLARAVRRAVPEADNISVTSCDVGLSFFPRGGVEWWCNSRRARRMVERYDSRSRIWPGIFLLTRQKDSQKDWQGRPALDEMTLP